MDGIQWDELLPNREWKHFSGQNWAHLMPAPSAQMLHLLPEGFGGCCAVHAYSEAFTVILRRLLISEDVCVDLPELLRMCVEEGVLTSTGSKTDKLGDFVKSNGVPMVGRLPDHITARHDERNQVADHLADICAMGSKLIGTMACPLPFGTPTATEAEAAMAYRETLCAILDVCPIVICLPPQEHYGVAREEGEPYRRIEGGLYMESDSSPWWYFGLFGSQPLYHCVTAFGYDCPGGDVRSLRIHYQENARGAPGDQPARHTIDPDAILYYYVPVADKVTFCNRPVG